MSRLREPGFPADEMRPQGHRPSLPGPQGSKQAGDQDGDPEVGPDGVKGCGGESQAWL